MRDQTLKSLVSHAEQLRRRIDGAPAGADCEERVRKLVDLERRIAAMPAESLAGAAAKARVLRANTDDSDDLDCTLARAVADDLAALAEGAGHE